MPDETRHNQTPRGTLVPAEAAPGDVPLGWPKPWTLRDLIFFITAGLLALITANVLIVLGYTVLERPLGWRAPAQALRDNAFFLLAIQLVFYLLLLGYIYLLVAVSYRLPFWSAVGWRTLTTAEARKFFLGGILLAAVVQIAPPLLPDKESFPLMRLFRSPQAAYTLAAFAVLVAPLMEELVFRGVFFRFFERLIGLRFAIVGTAALFAGLHIQEYWGAWNHVFLIFLAGLVFSLARGLTGSLAPSVVLHLAYNASLVVILYFQTQHFRALEVILRS